MVGATDFSYRIAKQFDVPLVETRPALVPLTFDESGWQSFIPMAGISLEVDIACGEKKTRGEFKEDLLFTHRGLSGPAVLQISSYWCEGAALTLNLLPALDVLKTLIDERQAKRDRSAHHIH